MASAKWASTAASRESVLASVPVALAKSRTWRGLTTTTGSAAAARAATNGTSQTARCLQQHHGGTYIHDLGNQFPDAGFVVRRGPSLSRRPDGNIHLRLRDINAYVSRVLFHLYLLRQRWPVLARYGLDWPRQLFGLCL